MKQLKNRPPISFEIKNIELLERMYMPFFKTGGIFIPNKEIKPSTSIIIILKINLPELKGDYTISGKVQWFSPEKSNFHSGSGIAFDDNPANKKLKDKIEKIIVNRKTEDSLTL